VSDGTRCRPVDDDLMQLAEDLVSQFGEGLTEAGRGGLTRGIARLLDHIAHLEAEREYVTATRVGRARRPGSSGKAEEPRAGTGELR